MPDAGSASKKRLIQPVFVPETMPVLRLLETFKASPVHIAFMVDEYGDFLGLATLNDVLEGIAGDLGEEHEQHSETSCAGRTAHGWSTVAHRPTNSVEKLRLAGNLGEFHTAAGFALERLAHIPVECETFEIPGWRVEILDMDGKRIDKLLFTPMPETADG